LDYYGLMTRTLRLTALVVLVASLGVHPVFSQTQNASPDAPTSSSLDGELFYQLLLGELNAIGGEPGVGFSLYLDAARKTSDARLFKRATDIALQARSGESALQAARAWRQALPTSREANRYLFQILIGLNRVVEAVEPLKHELSLTDTADRIATINAIPRLFARVADKKLAASVVEQALVDYLRNPEVGPTAWTTVGRMRLDAADPVGSLDAARRGQALDATAEEPAILALNLMDRKIPKSEAIVLKHLQGKPRIEFRLDYARVLLNNQRYAESAAQLEAITAERPDYSQAWLIKGTLELQNKQPVAAEQSLRRFVEMEAAKPESPDAAESSRGLTQAYLALSALAEQKSDFAEARAWLAKIDNSEEMISVQMLRATILAREGKLDEARALIRALPEPNPADARMKISAEVQLLRDNKQFRAAYELLKDAMVRYPQDTGLMYDQAMVAEKLGDLSEMERLLRLAIAIKPDYQHAYNALGYSFADRNVRLPEARELVRKALEYAPGDPFISDSLAWVEFRSGNLQEALRILQQAFKDKPDAEIAAHLGEVLWTMGDHPQAVAVWKEGIQLNAENETLQETLKRLQVKP
jgi:tetratricopeptide (TPR) repeat protein